MADAQPGESQTAWASGIAVCIPVFNDWDCVLQLMEQLDATGLQLRITIHVILVNDGSTVPPPERFAASLRAIQAVEVVHLRRNVGHQRAIALGLAFINENLTADAVIVMDGDGEDSPRDIQTLLQKCVETGCSKIIFAKRRKRTEGLVFRLGYVSYKVLHFLLTGRGVNIGNFSVIPASVLPNVVGVSELWNHYAAGVVHARLPMDVVPIDRAQRLTGQSKMNFVSLIAHGMSAIAVFGDLVGVRLLCVVSALTTLVVAGLFVVVGIRLFTSLAIPGWATNAVGLLAAILLNLLLLSVVFVLFVLQARSMAGFLPARDWKDYVANRTTLFRLEPGEGQ